MTSSVYKKVGIASAIMIASVFLSRVFGVIREMVIAYLAGTSGSVDAYQFSFIIPEILNHIAATGFLSITFIPIFSRYLVDHKEEEAWKIFSNILNSFGLGLLVLIVLLWISAEWLIGLTGFENADTFAEAVRMTRIIIPAQLLFFAGGILMAVQFAKERFLIPALAPLIYNICIIGGGSLLYGRLGMEGFSWGALFGAFVGNFALQWFGARSIGMRWRPVIDFRHAEFKRYIILTLPLIVGLTMTFSVEVIPKLFGSYLSQGSIASLNYGLRIMFLLVGLLGQAVGTASYPYLSRLAAENKIGELNRLLNGTLKRISLVIPCSVLVVVLREEIVSLIFERGEFDASSTQLTSNILVFLMIGAFAFSAQTLVNRGYYAVQNTLLPTICVSAVVILTLPLFYLGMITLQIFGVALALSVTTIAQVILLFALWNRRSDNREGRSVYLFYGKIMLLSLPIGLLLYGFKERVLSMMDPSTLPGSLFHLFAVSGLFALLLIGSGYLFRITEIMELPDLLIERIRKRTR